MDKFSTSLNRYLKDHSLHLSVRHFVHTPENTLGFHQHTDFYELVVVISGTAMHMFENRGRSIAGGDIFLIKPGEYHCYRNPDNLEIYNLLFARDVSDDLNSHLSGLNGFRALFGMNIGRGEVIHLPEKIFVETVSTLKEIAVETDRTGRDSTLAVFSDFLRVMLLLSRHGTLANMTCDISENSLGLGKFMAELDQNYSSDWTPERMARSAGMSGELFRKEFKKFSGQPPMAYLAGLRLEKAAVLLGISGENVSRIGISVGFSDSNYFTRCFTRRFGVSPLVFRKRMNGRDEMQGC